MGAWDVGSFANDDALDFVDEIKGIGDLVEAFDGLGPSEAYVQVDAACRAIAAADTVAAMMGRPASDFPDRLGDTVAGLGAAGEALIAAAVGAVRRVRASSELADLWADAAELDWQGTIDDLLVRLDPAAPWTPPPPREDEPVGEVTCLCLVCDGDIPAAEAVTVRFEDDDGIVSAVLTLHAHRDCLVRTFDAPHFAENSAPHPDLLARIRAWLDSSD